MAHTQGPVQEFTHIHSHQSCREQAKIGKGRVAPADIGKVEEGLAVTAFPGHLHQRCVWVGNDTEVLAGPLALDLLELLVEIFCKSQRFSGGPRFTGNNEQGIFEREGATNFQDGGRIGGIQNCQ